MDEGARLLIRIYDIGTIDLGLARSAVRQA